MITSHSNWPGYNEVKTICATLTESCQYFRSRGRKYEIILAAHGDDGTREIVRELANGDAGVWVIGETARRGKEKGIREAVISAPGAIVGSAVRLLKGYQGVNGSRTLGRSQNDRKPSFHRRIGSRVFSFFLRAVVGMGDMCGFRFFPLQIGKGLFDGDSLIQLSNRNLRNVAEIFRIPFSCARQGRLAPQVEVEAANSSYR